MVILCWDLNKYKSFDNKTQGLNHSKTSKLGAIWFSYPGSLPTITYNNLFFGAHELIDVIAYAYLCFQPKGPNLFPLYHPDPFTISTSFPPNEKTILQFSTHLKHCVLVF